MIERWRRHARRLRRLAHALAIAARDPRTPMGAKILAAVVVGYALSPIDLVPDPTPVLGYLDDLILILIPFGISLAIRLIPPLVWDDAQRRAHDAGTWNRPATWRAAMVIVATWIAVTFAVVLILRRWV